MASSSSIAKGGRVEWGSPRALCGCNNMPSSHPTFACGSRYHHQTAATANRRCLLQLLFVAQRSHSPAASPLSTAESRSLYSHAPNSDVQRRAGPFSVSFCQRLGHFDMAAHSLSVSFPALLEREREARALAVRRIPPAVLAAAGSAFDGSPNRISGRSQRDSIKKKQK